jgi:hypothetical protein
MKLFSRLITDEYFANLANILDGAETESDIYEAIVNAPFSNPGATTAMGLGIVVLLLENPKTKTIDRIALSNTEQAKGAVQASVKPFKEIKIPVGYKRNIIAQTIETGQPHTTSDWKNMFIPALTSEEARFNQAGAGIGCSVVQPIEGVRGALIFSYFLHPSELTARQNKFMKKYCRLVSKRLSKDGPNVRLFLQRLSHAEVRPRKVK